MRAPIQAPAFDPTLADEPTPAPAPPAPRDWFAKPPTREEARQIYDRHKGNPAETLLKWKDNQGDSYLKVASLLLLRRLGTFTARVGGTGEGWSFSVREFNYVPVSTRTTPRVEVPHPAPPKGEIAYVPVTRYIEAKKDDAGGAEYDPLGLGDF